MNLHQIFYIWSVMFTILGLAMCVVFGLDAGIRFIMLAAATTGLSAYLEGIGER